MGRVPVLIIGGGVGGLATAVALGRAGVRVRVLERAPVLEPLGAGVTLFPNAVRALRRLGISGLEAMRATSAPGGFWRCDGTLLVTEEPAQLERRYGAPLVALHRVTCRQPCWSSSGTTSWCRGPTLDTWSRTRAGSSSPSPTVHGSARTS